MEFHLAPGAEQSSISSLNHLSFQEFYFSGNTPSRGGHQLFSVCLQTPWNSQRKGFARPESIFPPPALSPLSMKTSHSKHSLKWAYDTEYKLDFLLADFSFTALWFHLLRWCQSVFMREGKTRSPGCNLGTTLQVFSCKAVQSCSQKITGAKSDFISLEESISSKTPRRGLWKAQNTTYTLCPGPVAISDCWHMLILADFLILLLKQQNSGTEQIKLSKQANHPD